MGDYNVTVADFAGKNRICMTDTLYQYDYGQKLQIDNIPALPQTYEAHFSNVQHGGVSITVTGMDGIVDIPNALLMTGKRIYCWIYVTEPGSGETEYQVLMPVQARPMPEYYDVTDTGAFDSVVQQVGEYAATATAGATNATASAAAAATSASEAAASASAAETAKNAAQTAQGKAEDAQAAAETAAQTATEKAQQTAQDAAQAALDAGRAESAAQSAEAAQMGAESSKTDAETAAQGAAASASAASASATSAGQAATSAGQSATAAIGSATTAQGAAQTATTKAGEASASADAAAASETAAQTAQTAAEAAETNAGQSASTATTKAGEAAQSASSAAQSKTDAEAAATRAEQAAATLTVDSALSDTSVNPVQNKAVTESVTQVKSALSGLNHDIYGIETVTPTVADGRGVYYGGSTASIVSAPRTSVFFPVSVGLTYHVKTNGEVFRLGFATDSDITPESTGNYLFDYQKLDGETEYTFTVSNSNYTFCYITYKYQDNQTATIEIKQTGIGLIDIVTARTVEISEINDQIKPKETIIAQNSYIDYRDGRTIGNYPGLNVTEFKVSDGMAVVYDYTYSAPDIRGLAFYDVYGRYISGAQVATQSQTINVPGNACTCRATVDDVGRVKLFYLSEAVGILNEQIHSSALKTYGDPLDKVTDETGLLDLFLKVGCIGDSLASGESYYNEGSTPHAVDLYQYSWGQFLARKTGNTYYNFSAGGLSTRTWLSSEYATECFDGEHNCQAYIIGLGQNDANADIPIGTSADIKADYSQNPDTFYGNYGKIIQKIKEIVSKAKIFVITDMNTSTNRKGYNTAIRDMANIFENVYVLDFREYGLKYYNLPIVAGQMRNSHYNAFGYKLFSMMIANYINWIMINNYTEFTQVEFIDSSHSWTDN